MELPIAVFDYYNQNVIANQHIYLKNQDKIVLLINVVA